MCWVCHTNIPNFKLGELRWQGAFQLKQKQPDSLYVIWVLLGGSIKVWINQQRSVYSSPNSSAAIVNPGEDLVAIASERGQALLICIERNLVEQALANLLGRSLKRSVVFEPEIDLTHDLGRSLMQFLQFLWRVEDGQTAPSSLVVEELEQTFLACLVKGLPHNYSEELLYHSVGALACYVRKAQAFIEVNVQADIHLEDMAAAVGVSPRILEKAFAHHCDCSPIQFLKQLRLRLAREYLCHAPPGTKVMDVMLRYGFVQGGKFARAYRKMFGELPSQTLKQHRKAIAQQGNAGWQ
jgi:AraC-like DNA-binding protein